MGKRKSSPLKGKEAEVIAGKLSEKTDINRNPPHIRATIRYNGKAIGQFGWRHDKKASNGHIPHELRISPHDALEMAKCNINYDGYIELLKKKKLL